MTAGWMGMACEQATAGLGTAMGVSNMSGQVCNSSRVVRQLIVWLALACGQVACSMSQVLVDPVQPAYLTAKQQHTGHA